LLSFLDLGLILALAFFKPYTVPSFITEGVHLKIAEVRQLLDAFSNDQLKAIIVEIYKIIPKHIKEEQAVDDLLKKPPTPGTKREKPKPEPPDFELLCDDVKQFMEDAYAQYYYTPNSVVPKKDRPKWRFLVKRFYRDLINASTIDQQLPQAAELLKELYILLCYSCAYILFSAYDPFQSVGIPQVELFRQVLKLNIRIQTKPDFIHHSLTLILDQPLNRYTLRKGLMVEFLDFLKIPDLKEATVAKCGQFIRETKTAPPKAKEKAASSYGFSNEHYKKEERLQNLALMGFLCYVSLGEYDHAIAFFRENHTRDSEEVTLFILLGELFELQLPDYWLREFEADVRRGIVPREKLQQVYEFLSSNGRFPERFY